MSAYRVTQEEILAISGVDPKKCMRCGKCSGIIRLPFGFHDEIPKLIKPYINISIFTVFHDIRSAFFSDSDYSVFNRSRSIGTDVNVQVKIESGFKRFTELFYV